LAAAAVLTALVVIFLPRSFLQGQDPVAGPAAAVPAEVRFTDGSVLKLSLCEERVGLKTPYGLLSIPLHDVARIEFAGRVPEDIARHVEGLGSAEYPVREAAEAALARTGGRALAALTAAETHKDLEVARRVKDLLDRLRQASAEGIPDMPKQDVVYTTDAKFTGHIANDVLKAESQSLGTLRLRLCELKELRVEGMEAEPDRAAALPDPGNLSSYQQQVGKRFLFKVTGATGGTVWGTDVYTSDSNLAAAAVHAGVLRAGQVGYVRVKMVPAPPGFMGSTRHGVTSQGFGTYPAFQILR
jgi:hypothetical protein